MNNKYSILIARYLSGEASGSEVKLLESWISASDENRRIFDEEKRIWQKASIPQPEEIPSFDEFWQAIETGLEDDKSLQKKTSLKPQGFIDNLISALFNGGRTGYAWASASAAVILLVLFAFYFLNKGSENKNKFQTYATKYAERTLLNLPDGSEVELNSDSKIAFPEKFSEDKRLVKFSGQAFFRIKKNGSPFIIETGNAEIKVLGTQFDVKARDQQTEVIVKEGKVAFKALSEPEDSAVILKTNEKSVCKGNLFPKSIDRVNADYAIAWLNHKFVFKKTPLNEIAGELERTFNKKITLSDRDLGNLTITGEFRDQNLEQILSSICLTLNLRSRKVNDGYLISR